MRQLHSVNLLLQLRWLPSRPLMLQLLLLLLLLQQQWRDMQLQGKLRVRDTKLGVLWQSQDAILLLLCRLQVGRR